jgi:hypothetical protein
LAIRATFTTPFFRLNHDLIKISNTNPWMRRKIC